MGSGCDAKQLQAILQHARTAAVSVTRAAVTDLVLGLEERTVRSLSRVSITIKICRDTEEMLRYQ